MIGCNGGLLGSARTSRRGAAVGTWTLNEQVLYQRQNAWIGDASFDSVSLLLHMDGSNGSTTFTDSSSNALTVTVNGNAQISTAQSKFGGASAAFDGTGDFLQLDGSNGFVFGSSDWTIEAWYYVAVASVGQTLIEGRASGEGANRWVLYCADNSANVTFWSNGLARLATLGAALNAWNHVAVARASGVTRLFLNGVQQGSNYSDTTVYGIGTSRPRVGINLDGNAAFNGYIDDLRITKGVARYTANFTAPTAPFPNL